MQYDFYNRFTCLMKQCCKYEQNATKLQVKYKKIMLKISKEVKSTGFTE